jgi:soluble lytic murein transglycosylase
VRVIAKPSENILIPRPFCGSRTLGMKFAFRLVRLGGACLILSFPVLAAAALQHKGSAQKKPAAPAEKQLEELARALKQKNPATYARLSAIAMQKSSGVLGMRAALVLGYYDYNRAHYPEAAKWLARAKNDPLLGEYALYWSAETNIALNRNADALAQLGEFRQKFPDSVMTEQALQSLGVAALALNRPDEALAALDAYALTVQRPALLFLRAEVREQSGHQLDAATDYQTIYSLFPASEQAREAGEKLNFLRSSNIGKEIPAIPVEEQIAHAALLFNAKEWGDARNEYSHLASQLSGADRERATLRVMECEVQLGTVPSALADVKITDADVDAERFYALAQWYRSQQREPDMAAAVESAVSRAPASHWAEVSLFLAGNYYWVQLDRDRAAGFYKRLTDNFPTSPDATPSNWRFTWVAVLKRQQDAAQLLAQHLRQYPGSQFTPDALYWLGRLAEETENLPLARSYYGKLQERYQQNYFESLAAVRVRSIGSEPTEDTDLLATIPPVVKAQPVGDTIPAAAVARQARADALRSIAFDASAELELRAAYAATGEPRLLLEAAQAAVAAGHVGAAIVTVRQIYPQLDSRPFDQVPHEVWLAAYPLPFGTSIRQWSAHAGVDPMLTAGLIRQESAFAPDAHSGANALGLMQLLPKTARQLAKKAKVKYSHALLFDPDYNVRLGTIYVAGLKNDFGSVESALAAYNAGEDRVAQWTAGQSYRDLAEFVDSIPFTETREYVEIVTRNAVIYRKLYGAKENEPVKVAANRKHQP